MATRHQISKGAARDCGLCSHAMAGHVAIPTVMNSFYRHPMIAPILSFFMEEFGIRESELPGVTIAKAEEMGNTDAKGGYFLPLNLFIFSQELLELESDEAIFFVFVHEFMHFLQGKMGLLSVDGNQVCWMGHPTNAIAYEQKPEEKHVDAMLAILFMTTERPVEGAFKRMFNMVAHTV